MNADPPIIHLHTDEPFQVEVEERDEPDGVMFRYRVREIKTHDREISSHGIDSDDDKVHPRPRS